MMSFRRPRAFAMAMAAGAMLLGSCGYDATKLPEPSDGASGAGPGTKPVQCDNPTQSYAPSNNEQAARKELLDDDFLVVGVSADTLKLGSSNPFKGFEIEGFDIDVARAIAEALDVTLKLRVINAADRLRLLGAEVDGKKHEPEIDLVVRNMTMNCTRWSQIGFSAVYYNATQKVLLREDDVPAFEKSGIASLDGKRVCAPNGSTSLDNIVEAGEEAGVKITTDPAANHTGCLVKFQQGAVEAITGDDTVLAGLAAQDPYAVVPEQEKLTDEPYGIGANKDDVDLIRFINSVLEERRRNGEWQASYNTWLKPYLGDATPPTPQYGR